MRARRTWVIPGVVVALAVASVATSTPAGATHGKAQDQKIAQAGLLVPSDFTTDWTEQTGGGTSTTKFASAAQDAGGACKRYAATATLTSTKPNATSSVYTNGTAEAANHVAVLTNPAQAKAALTAFEQSTTAACLTKVLPTTLPATFALDPELGKVKSMKVTVKRGDTAPIADANAAWEATVNAKLASGKATTIFLNVEAVAVGRAFDTFEFIDAKQPLDGIHDHLIASSVGRLQGALDTTALGETALLASLMTPVPGYTYEEAPVEAQINIAAELSDPNIVEYVRGESLHSIVTTDGTSIGLLLMVDYRPSYVALPGFKAATLTSAAQANLEGTNGTSAPGTISGQPVVVNTYGDGTTGTFVWVKNVVVFVQSGPDPAATNTFITEYLARTPA